MKTQTTEEQIRAEFAVFNSLEDSNPAGAVESLERLVKMYQAGFMKKKRASIKDRSDESSRKELIDLKHSYVGLFSSLGRMHAKMGDHEQAIQEFERAWSFLPASMVELTERERAKLKDSVKARILDPLWQAYRQADPDRIHDMKKRCERLMMSPVEMLLDSREGWCDLGVAFHNKENVGDAIACYNKALRRYPDHKRAQFLLLSMYGMLKAIRQFFPDVEREAGLKGTIDSLMNECGDLDGNTEGAGDRLEVKVDGRTLISYTKQKKESQKNDVAEFTVTFEDEFVEAVSEYHLLEVGRKEIVKVYSDPDAGDSEEIALEFFHCLGAPKPIKGFYMGGVKINRIEFFEGETLYEKMEEGTTPEEEEPIFEQMVELIVKMQAMGKDMPGIDKKTTSKPNYFVGYQRNKICPHVRTREGQLDINENNYSFVNKLLQDSIRKRGVYRVDSTPRNVFVKTGGKVAPIDLEKNELSYGEYDLVKLMRYSLEFDKWDDSVDYKAGEDRTHAEEYLAAKRYLDKDRERRRIEQYYRRGGHNPHDESIQMELRAGMVQIHMFYLGWAEKNKKKGETKKERGRRINRQKYHLLELKVTVDSMIDGLDAYVNKTGAQEERGRWETELRSLRKELDEVQL